MSEQSYISFYLRSNVIRVFVSAIRKIRQPRFIRFMLNTETMQLVMIPADRKDFQSFRVPKGVLNPGTKRQNMAIHSQQFCHLLSERLGWNENYSYRVPGTVFAEQNLARYDLSKATVIRTVSENTTNEED
ncbi:MAG: hypothetical protein IJI45_11100 [Anaerolineaceae bacterium]|nr:hypothetical protein [Anaerolineaceae bacterium]